MYLSDNKGFSENYIPRPESQGNGAFWLVRLRWLAIIAVVIVSLGLKAFLNTQLNIRALLYISAGLCLENVLIYSLLHYSKKNNKLENQSVFTIIINIQIIIDLIFLILILYFTGGIENTIYLFFLFHLVISSMLLSKTNSYLICCFANLLLIIETSLEYSGVIEHRCLWEKHHIFVNLNQNISYIAETLIIFLLTSFLIVYMANTIVSIIRKQKNILQQTNDKLRQMDLIKNQYVLRLTHDIKGHLAAIQINLSLVIDKLLGELNEKQSEAINNVHERAVRLTDFVNRLLNLTYMRLNNKVEIEIFPIHDAIEKSVSLVKNIADKKSLILRHHVDSTISNITNNRFALEELVSSLLLNAIRYTPENGKIDLIVKDNDDDILIEVSDTGIGIPEDETDKIFEEFYRASNAKQIKNQGTGLGLAIVKEIVDLYKGRIWVKSKVNVGTTFFVVFPKNITMVEKHQSNIIDIQ